MMTAMRWQRRSSVEVVLELGEERRRAGTGAVEVGLGSRPFIGVDGRWRHRGLNGQRQCRALKTLVTLSEEGGFKTELERATELRRG
jgi:hypothetical protein